MVQVPTYGELLRTVADLMKENKADRAEFEAIVGRLEKRVDRLEQENASLRSRLDKNSAGSNGESPRAHRPWQRSTRGALARIRGDPNER